MKESVIVNIRLPPNIIEWLDTLVDSNLFNSRSEAIREFAREYCMKWREHGR